MTDSIFDAAPAYWEGDTAVVRASSLGACTQMLARCLAGQTPAPPPDDIQTRYDEGHAHEEAVLLAGLGVDWIEVQGSELERLGTVIVDPATGREQVEVEVAWGGEGARRVVRCHPDGFARRRDRPPATNPLHVVEVKFLGPDMHAEVCSQIDKGGLAALTHRFYSWQFDIEMLATGFPLVLIIGRKRVREVVKGDGEVERIVDLDPADGSVRVYEFLEPHRELRDVKARVAEIVGAARRAEDGGGWPACPVPFDYPCGFWAEHEGEDRGIEDAALEELVLEYAMHQTVSDAEGAKAKAVKDKIRARLGELGRDGGRCGGFDITVNGERPGNVSWKSAWDSLPADARAGVDVDGFRGKPVAASVTMKPVKKA